ncbi:MAG TPA: ABC transporter substrate-binding protein [Candidatus Limnocylindria bacterium]|nr:ABC transporter substrate-binding protein [Candidatus Limnocylindria bacterium]
MAALADPAWAGPPTEQLRAYTDRVVRILEDPALDPTQRRTEIHAVAREAFDVAESARRALGPHWPKRSAAEREEFTGLFQSLLERGYLSRIGEYGGERVQYVAERIDGDFATVRAQIVTSKGTQVPVEARVVRRGERWLMYDVLIENVSLVASYRSQFDRVIRTSSYEELVRRLKARGQP